jgi:hypothetical protein
MQIKVESILLTLLIMLLVYSIFFQPKPETDFSFYKKQQEDIRDWIKLLNIKMDSSKNAGKIIKEHYTTIIKEVEVKKYENENTNDIDSLRDNFNKYFFTGPAIRF